MKQIIIHNIPVELERKRIKNMYLKILPPDGRIHISAPMRMSEIEIIGFVTTKLEWIKNQQLKLQSRHTHQEINYSSGDEVYFRGEKYSLSIVERTARPDIILEGDTIILYIKENSTIEQRKKRLDSWYKEYLQEEIPPLLHKWESIIGVKTDSFRIRDMKTRWGTCNTRSKNICLSLQLAKKPPKCLEYVIVHELVHLLEKSHNYIFKGYLDRYLPEWRSIKKELNGLINL